MDKLFIVRNTFFSFSTAYSSFFLLFLIAIFSAFVLLMSLSLGSEWISPITVFNTLFNHETLASSFVVIELRLPRILMASMVGAGLGVSGLILQSMVRNPLASPDIIGITGGASAAAVCFLSFFSTVLSMAWLPLFAISGALSAALAIYCLAWRNGISPMSLVLVGVGISSAMGAITTFVISASPLSTSISAYIWLTGSVYGANWHAVIALFPWLIVSLVLVLCLSRKIDVLEMGDSISTGLGISVQTLRLLLLGLSVSLAAPAIAYAGAIGFVGLIAPHIARQLVARRFALLMPATMLIGASLVMLSDLCGRLLFQPLDIPAGVFVSAIGAPFFIYLLFRQRF